RCTEHATFALATPSTPLEPGVIAGRVWHDLCATTGSEGGVPASPSEGRIPEAGSGCRANGRMEQDARLSIEVRDAAGRIAEEAVEERLADVAGSRVARSTTTVGGTEAIVLDPMPGQELSRQVLSPRATWPMN
ncbi:MAG TPA: hypothetical protein VM366_18625, partial [Anaerolineae bacterium]|nr:hypothetical protein [Anaerolineae bacterium]